MVFASGLPLRMRCCFSPTAFKVCFCFHFSKVYLLLIGRGFFGVLVSNLLSVFNPQGCIFHQIWEVLSFISFNSLSGPLCLSCVLEFWSCKCWIICYCSAGPRGSGCCGYVTWLSPVPKSVIKCYSGVSLRCFWMRFMFKLVDFE